MRRVRHQRDVDEEIRVKRRNRAERRPGDV